MKGGSSRLKVAISGSCCSWLLNFFARCRASIVVEVWMSGFSNPLSKLTRPAGPPEGWRVRPKQELRKPEDKTTTKCDHGEPSYSSSLARMESARNRPQNPCFLGRTKAQVSSECGPQATGGFGLRIVGWRSVCFWSHSVPMGLLDPSDQLPRTADHVIDPPYLRRFQKEAPRIKSRRFAQRRRTDSVPVFARCR